MNIQVLISSSVRQTTILIAQLATAGYIDGQAIATRNEVLARFHRDDDQLVRGVLHDLTESGLIFSSGTGDGAVYRMATREDISHVRDIQTDAGPALDAMVWAIIYREGPIAHDEIARRVVVAHGMLADALNRLEQAERVKQHQNGSYECRELVVLYGSSVGWEAAVFDHFQSVVRTICCKLRRDEAPQPQDVVGGSTYTFVVWEGHPLNDETLGVLRRFREHADALRSRVDAYNDEHGIPARHRKVLAYAGQSLTEEVPDQ